MKDTDLNRILQSAAVPNRADEYWEAFPKRVTAAIQDRERQERLAEASQTVQPRDSSRVWTPAFQSRLAVGIGLAAIFLVLGFVVGSWHSRRSRQADPQFVEMQKFFHEIEALFPNQLQVIAVDDQGARLILAEKANVPASTPIYLRICGPKGCQRFVTFSGQQIRVGGETCEVLLNREGHVIVLGRQMVWSSAESVLSTGEYRIEARPLAHTG